MSVTIGADDYAWNGHVQLSVQNDLVAPTQPGDPLPPVIRDKLGLTSGFEVGRDSLQASIAFLAASFNGSAPLALVSDAIPTALDPGTPPWTTRSSPSNRATRPGSWRAE